MAGRLFGLSLRACALTALLAGFVLAGCDKRTESAANTTELPLVGGLAVEARLEEIPGPFPANDLYDYVYVMKYRVVKVLRGTYDDSIILVGHYNPRLARSEITGTMDSLVDGSLTSFNPGDVHRLVLTRLDSVWTQAVEDDYFRDGRARYFARWVSK